VNLESWKVLGLNRPGVARELLALTPNHHLTGVRTRQVKLGRTRPVTVRRLTTISDEELLLRDESGKVPSVRIYVSISFPTVTANDFDEMEHSEDYSQTS
jgi:hypothetical protein